MTQLHRLALSAALCSGIAFGIFTGLEKPVLPGNKAVEPPVANTWNARTSSDESAVHAITPSPDVHVQTDGLASGLSDVAAAYKRLLSEKDPTRRRWEIDGLCATLDAAGAKSLLEILARENTSFALERELTGELLARWAELDPRAAAGYAIQARGYPYGRIESVMRVWAEKDLGAAKQWALESKSPGGRSSAIGAIVRFLAQNDPQAAISFLNELPATEDKRGFVPDLFSPMARKNLAQAAELATQLSTRALRQPAADSVALVWGQREPGKALAWYFENFVTENDWRAGNVVQNIFQKWTSDAPEEAVAFAAALPPGTERQLVISKLGECWGAVNPHAAVTWLQTLPKSRESYKATQGVLSSWARNDPTRAADFVLSMPADRSRYWLLAELASGWGHEDPRAALEWATKHPEPEVERLVAANALGVMAARDLPNSMSYISRLTTPKAQSVAIQRISEELPPEKAANWLMQMAKTLPVGNEIQWPIQRWAQSDPGAVAAWLKQQPAGAQTDAAIGGYAVILARNDGAAAANWATSIADNGLRLGKLKTVITTWAERDEAAARTWVMGQRFPANEQQAILAELERATRK